MLTLPDGILVVFGLQGTAASLVGYALIGRAWGGLVLLGVFALAGDMLDSAQMEWGAAMILPFMLVEFPVLWLLYHVLKKREDRVRAWVRVALAVAGLAAYLYATNYPLAP